MWVFRRAHAVGEAPRGFSVVPACGMRISDASCNGTPSAKAWSYGGFTLGLSMVLCRRRRRHGRGRAAPLRCVRQLG
jgi:hypothetical protein